MKKKYNQLSSEERDKIAILRAKGIPIGDIAKQIGRNKSTISRELNRNSTSIYNIYLPHRADERAKERKREAGKRDRLKNEQIRKYVIKKLKKGWSPEQITGRIQMDLPGLNISHEAIYQYIYDPKIRNETNLVLYLARSHRIRKRKRQSKKHGKTHIPDRISIDLRPKYIERRKQAGHWEADTITSRQSKSCLGVVAERTSRLVKISKLEQKSASELRKAINRRLSRFPQNLRRTITYDNGSENVEHIEINKVLGTRSYFCNPFHSWERGTIEFTNGLIRRYFPKKTNFAIIDKEQIRMVENNLNNRPRKCLNFQTPLEFFKSRCCTS